MVTTVVGERGHSVWEVPLGFALVKHLVIPKVLDLNFPNIYVNDSPEFPAVVTMIRQKAQPWQ